MTALRTIVADGLTPVRAYAALRRAAGDGASFLLESVVGGERWGRYCILGYRPTYELTLTRHGWSVKAGPGATAATAIPTAESLNNTRSPRDVLAGLHGLIHERTDDHVEGEATTRADNSPYREGREHPAARFAKAHIGYVAWDIVHLIDKVPPGDESTWNRHFLPLARLLGGATVVVFDSLAQTVTIAGPDDSAVDRALRDLAHPPELTHLEPPDQTRLPSDISVDLDDNAFIERVRAAQEFIAAGDAFQVVLARTFSVPKANRDAFDVYRAMRLLNPSPYMYFLDFPPTATERHRTRIAGASPETLVRLENGTMTVRPIAGTRRRGKTPDEDAKLERELLADPKELAEHVMLIDLGRNDVGRVSEIGSVSVTKRMQIERYSHVMHIVSEVTGRVSPSNHAFDVLRSAFPAGTLSGAPKVRAMQIIRELEARPRGIYGGAVGYVVSASDLDFAIAIRTLVDRGDRFEVTAGAGIVDASSPQAEADETRAKARAVLCAIEAAPQRRIDAESISPTPAPTPPQ